MSRKQDYDSRKEAEKAKNEKRRAESWFNKIKDPVTQFTGLLTILAGLQTCILYKTDSTLNETMIAANRAWLSFVGAKFQRGIDSEEGPIVVGLYENVGRYPALDIRAGGAWNLVTLWKPLTTPDAFPEIVGGWERINQDVRKGCRAAEPVTGNVTTFPNAHAASSFTVKNPSPIPDLKLIKGGTNIMLVTGCLTYNSFDRTRHTGFCQYLRNNSGLEFATCPAGNFAE